MTTVQSMIPSGFPSLLDAAAIQSLKTVLILALSIAMLGGVLRLILGPGSTPGKAVSAGIHLLLLYCAVIGLFQFTPKLAALLPPLPYVSVTAESFTLQDLSLIGSVPFFSGCLRLFLLAVLTNLFEEILPKGNKFITWFLLRLAGICVVLSLYAGICVCTDRYVPEFFGQWAGLILLTVWASIGLLLLSKGMLTLIAAVVNPVLGLLFAFFFSNIVGKQFTKAIVSSLLVLGVIFTLYSAGIQGLLFAQFSYIQYVLSLGLVTVLLYIFSI